MAKPKNKKKDQAKLTTEEKKTTSGSDSENKEEPTVVFDPDALDIIDTNELGDEEDSYIPSGYGNMDTDGEDDDYN